MVNSTINRGGSHIPLSSITWLFSLTSGNRGNESNKASKPAYNNIISYNTTGGSMQNIRVAQKILNEIMYKDDDTHIKFSFNKPYKVQVTYRDDCVSIDDDYLNIYIAEKSEKEVIDSYALNLNFFWNRYIDNENIKISKGLEEKNAKLYR